MTQDEHEEQPEMDERAREVLAQAEQLVGRDPLTMGIGELLGAVTRAAYVGTLPYSDGSAPLPAHVTCAVDYPTCPEGAEPARWAASEPYRSGWIDLIETGGAYQARADDPDYRAGVLAAAKWKHDGTADQPR